MLNVKMSLCNNFFSVTGLLKHKGLCDLGLEGVNLKYFFIEINNLFVVIINLERVKFETILFIRCSYHIFISVHFCINKVHM